VIIADPAKGIIKLRSEEFFGQVMEEESIPKYQWMGVLILLVKSESFQTGDETKGLFYIISQFPRNREVFYFFYARQSCRYKLFEAIYS